MRILFVSSEVAPFSKTGGLADVVASLPKALVELGLDVTIISPWYSTLKGEPEKTFMVEVPALAESSSTALASIAPTNHHVVIGESVLNGVRHWFVRLPDFARERFYGYADDVERFVHFCQVASKLAENLAPDVVHLNDWHSGYVAPMLRFQTQLKTRVVYTIHNLEFMGRWNPRDILRLTNLPFETFTHAGMEFFGDASAAKAGMVYSHAINTVSKTYAKEIQTPEFGCGLDGLLRARGVTGILNGLDTETWNPRTDPHIAKYSTFAAKNRARIALRRELGLAIGQPVLAMVSRLSQQKGLSLVLAALPEILRDWRFVILGEGEQIFSGVFSALTELSTKRVAYHQGFDEALAHKIYAGADALLMPSQFEPCGLSQMIAMRYGTVPVVRYTGGLVDSVPSSHGYGFQDYSAEALKTTLAQARSEFGSGVWQEKAEAGLKDDFSWLASARAYLNLYKSP